MFFRTNYRGQSPSARIIAEALNRIGHALNNITIDNSDAVITQNGIVLTSAAFFPVPFQGRYYFEGEPYSLSGTPEVFWYHDETANLGFWSPGPWPERMPDLQYWRITAHCKPIEFIRC
jgi:hypothetical protein